MKREFYFILPVQLFLLCGPVQLHDQHASAPVNYVFHFIPVKMHGRNLSFPDDQQLFRIRLFIGRILLISIT